MTLETRKRRRRSKSSKNRGKGVKGIPPKEQPNKVPKVNEGEAEPPANETKEDVLGSFSAVYQAIIKSFPVCLWPTSSKHGQHSYTVSLGLNAVELLVCFFFNCYLEVSPIIRLEFTVILVPRHIGEARCEVLLRQHAFKPKATALGVLLKGEQAKSRLIGNSPLIILLIGDHHFCFQPYLGR